MDKKIVEKIAKLLSLANSENQHEAELAANKANELLIKHNLRAADVAVSDYEKQSVIETTRMHKHYHFILIILKRHFFVDVVTSRQRQIEKTLVYLVGKPENVAIASYTFNFLVNTFERLWLKYKRENKAHITVKESYMSGLFRGLNEQLENNKKRVEKEEGLVVVGDKKLQEAIDHLFSGVKSGKKVKSNIRCDRANSHGFQEGQKIKISRGLQDSSGPSGKFLRG